MGKLTSFWLACGQLHEEPLATTPAPAGALDAADEPSVAFF